MDYNAFVNGKKTKLIAPAGYGKTYTIVKCLKHAQGKQLILTHTNAGIAAIKEKIKEDNSISSSKYNIETISGYIQKYVLWFYYGDETPPEKKDNKEYYAFLEREAIKVFRAPIIKKIISATYEGLFVDEYQDCNLNQHAIIMEISKVLATHILGDPLQGIYNFNGEPLVDFNSNLNDFVGGFQLDIPWRWKNSNNEVLGESLKNIRERLSKREAVNLNLYSSSIVMKKTNIDSIYSYINQGRESGTVLKYIDEIRKYIECESVLILIPEYFAQHPTKCFNKHFGSISDRKDIKSRLDYESQFLLVESIDHKDFYKVAKNCDSILKARNKYKKFKEFCLYEIFNSTDVKKWLGEKNAILKTDPVERARSANLCDLVVKFLNEPDYCLMVSIIKELRYGLKCKAYRKDLLSSVILSLENANLENITVYEAMIRHRDAVRHVGRKIKGKCIGTTLLTKGLEFDRVIILDAHKFPCHKNFYVAITRCCKELIIFTNDEILFFEK